MISGEDLRSPGQPTAGAVEAVDGLPVTSTETEGGPVDCAGGQAPSPLLPDGDPLKLRLVVSGGTEPRWVEAVERMIVAECHRQGVDVRGEAVDHVDLYGPGAEAIAAEFCGVHRFIDIDPATNKRTASFVGVMRLDATVGDRGMGSQVRSYVLTPYTMAKDLRTEVEVEDVHAILNGAPWPQPSPLSVLRERLAVRRASVHSYAYELAESKRRGDLDRSLAQYGMSAGLTAAIEMVDEMIREGR